MPLLTDKDRELLKWLKETADKHNVKITMPTHDHLTIHSPTGRIPRELTDPVLYYDPLGRRRTMFHSSKKVDPDLVLNIDYEQLELRLLASCAAAAGATTEEGPMSQEEGTTVTCPDCNQDFVVSPGEIKFLQERFGDDFAMPKRCKPCREENKKRKQQKRDNGRGGGRRR